MLCVIVYTWHIQYWRPFSTIYAVNWTYLGKQTYLIIKILVHYKYLRTCHQHLSALMFLNSAVPSIFLHIRACSSDKQSQLLIISWIIWSWCNLAAHLTTRMKLTSAYPNNGPYYLCPGWIPYESRFWHICGQFVRCTASIYDTTSVLSLGMMCLTL